MKFRDFIVVSNSSVSMVVVVALAAGFFSNRMYQTHILLIVPLLLSGYFLSMSAILFNNVVDLDIDGKMRRTAMKHNIALSNRRTLIISGSVAFVLGAGIGLVFENLLSVVFLIAGFSFYALFYTLFLKRHTRANILVGGIGGSLVAVSGWIAPSVSFGWIPFYLAVFILLWMPLHYWAFSILHSDDYTVAGIPMLPSTLNEANKGKLVVTTSLSIFIFSLTPVIYGIGAMLLPYLSVSIVMGIVVVWYSLRVGNKIADKNKIPPFLNLSVAYLLIMLLLLVIAA